MIGYHFFFIFYIIFACNIKEDDCITFCLPPSQDKTITGPTITVLSTLEIQNTVEISMTKTLTETETETKTETISLSSSLDPSPTFVDDEDPTPFVFFPVVEDKFSTMSEMTSSQESEAPADDSTSQEVNEQASSPPPCESTPSVED